MRVVYVSHFGHLGGAERSLLELIAAMPAHGVEPQLVCPEGALAQAAERLGVPVAHWPATVLTRSRGADGWLGTGPRLVRAWEALDRAMRRFEPDVVHVNSTQAMLWNGPVSWWRRRPVVWHWRDFYRSRTLARVLARSARAVVAISESVMEFARAQLGDGGPQITLVRNGVADLRTTSVTRAAERERLGVASSAPLIVMAGQSVPRKGHAILLRAFAALRRTRPDVRAWLLCCEHDEAASAHTRHLRALASELACTDAVRIDTGIDDISPALHAADVACVPSLREPFGRTAVEALLAEKPVVASDVDGLREIVRPGEDGWLVRPGDADDLAAALRTACDEQRAWAARGPQLRAAALQRFPIRRTAEEVAAVYASVRQGRAA